MEMREKKSKKNKKEVEKLEDIRTRECRDLENITNQMCAIRYKESKSIYFNGEAFSIPLWGRQ